MPRFLLGIPRCNEPSAIFAETLAAIQASTLVPERVVIVDNGDRALDMRDHLSMFDFDGLKLIRTQRNIGCAGAWNVACKEAGDLSVLLLNADLTVVPDTFEKLYAHPGPTIVGAHAFGCIRIDPEIRTKVGPFDEEFYPAYFEDADYRYRCKLAGVEIIEWEFKEVAIISPGRAMFSTGIAHGGSTNWQGQWSQDRYLANRQRYRDKWGVPANEASEMGFETFTQPFNKE